MKFNDLITIVESVSFEQFQTLKSNLSVPKKLQKEWNSDRWGEVNIKKAWVQIIRNRPPAIQVPRGFLESHLPFRRIKKENVETANPNFPGLAEFVRDETHKDYVGIRLIDGWHRAANAYQNNVEFYVYPYIHETSTLQNAYDFMTNNGLKYKI